MAVPKRKTSKARRDKRVPDLEGLLEQLNSAIDLVARKGTTSAKKSGPELLTAVASSSGLSVI